MLRDLSNAIRRFESDEIPDAHVVAQFGPVEVEDRTDHEGFFRPTLEPESELEPGWIEVDVKLLESPTGEEGIRATAQILVPPPDAEFGVISDLDDTVIETAATTTFTRLRLTLSKGAREPFPDAGRRAPLPAARGWTRWRRTEPLLLRLEDDWLVACLLARPK